MNCGPLILVTSMHNLPCKKSAAHLDNRRNVSCYLFLLTDFYKISLKPFIKQPLHPTDHDTVHIIIPMSFAFRQNVIGLLAIFSIKILPILPRTEKKKIKKAVSIRFMTDL